MWNVLGYRYGKVENPRWGIIPYIGFGLMHLSLIHIYKSYLSEVRNMGTISTERLIESVNEWQILRDSVYACIAKGTTSRPHQNPENTVRMLHDSLRIEFTRLALSQPRSFADVLLILSLIYI